MRNIEACVIGRSISEGGEALVHVRQGSPHMGDKLHARITRVSLPDEGEPVVTVGWASRAGHLIGGLTLSEICLCDMVGSLGRSSSRSSEHQALSTAASSSPRRKSRVKASTLHAVAKAP